MVNLELYNVLEEYNLQKIVYFYGKPFYENYDENKNYRKTANSQMLSELIKFDSFLTSKILGFIKSIEMRLSQFLSYEICNKLWNFGSRTSLFAIPKQNVFSNKSQFKSFIKKEFVSLQTNGLLIKSLNYSDFDEFWKLAINNVDISDKTLKNQNITDKKDLYFVPFYKIINKFTFGNLNILFQMLDKTYQINILNKLTINNIPKINPETWWFIFEQLRILRNRISHNESVFNYKFSLNELWTKKWNQQLFKQQKKWFNDYILDNTVLTNIYKDLKDKFLITNKNHNFKNLFNILEMINWRNLNMTFNRTEIEKEFNSFLDYCDEEAKNYLKKRIS